MPRYTTTGIPEHLATGSALGLSAFMPHFNRLAASGAQAYKGGVRGYPGTEGIPINPGRQGIPPSPDPGDMAQMGTSRSTDAPDSIWPNLYYVYPAEDYWPGAGMPIQMYNPVRPQDTTMIPVPATDLRSVYQARGAMSGGIAAEKQRAKALKQAFNFIRWPNRTTGNGPGSGSP
jgi:hypothetical protein